MRIERQTFRGVAGMSIWVMLSGLNASNDGIYERGERADIAGLAAPLDPQTGWSWSAPGFRLSRPSKTSSAEFLGGPIVAGRYREHSGHLLRLADIDPADVRVRMVSAEYRDRPRIWAYFGAAVSSH